MMKKSVVSSDLRRAVDWKLFELISGLISDETSVSAFEESKLWFQERHAQDVLEERFACGICGNPLCTEELKTYVKSSVKDKENGKRSLVTSSETKYRVDYATKEIYQVEKSKYYCSVNCLTATETWIASLDGTSPYARTHLTQALLNKESPIIQKQLQAATISIDEVLNLLPSSNNSTSPQKSNNNNANSALNTNNNDKTTNSNFETIDANSTSLSSQSKGNLPPPPFSHPHLSAEGTLQLSQVVQGKPIFLSENHSENASTGTDETILQENKRWVADKLAQATSQLNKHLNEDERQVQIAETHVPIVKKIRPSALRNNVTNSNTTDTSTNTTDNNSNKNSNTNMSTNEAHNDKVNTAEMFTDKSVDNSTPTDNNASYNDKDNSEILVEVKDKGTGYSAGRSGVAAQAVSHRGAKTVQWNDTTIKNANDANHSAINRKKRTPLVALKIVERDHVLPLSAAALPTKREPSHRTDPGPSDGAEGAVPSDMVRRDAASRIEGHSFQAKT